MSKEILCRTLLGTKNLEFSLECLQSFIGNSYNKIRLEIFDDGSMQPSDIQKIETLLNLTGPGMQGGCG